MSWFNSALAATDIGSEVTKVADWLFVWRRALTDIIELKHKLDLVGFSITATDKTRRLDDKSQKKSEKKSQSSQNPKPQNPSSTLRCTGCGMSKYVIETCRFKDSKYFNKTTAPFVGSSSHALLVAELGPRAYIPTRVEREALSG